MKARWKWILAAGALIVSAPLLLVGGLALFLDQAHYKAQLSDAVETSTGRPLIIDGALKLAVGMKPRFYAESIRYPNAPWGSQPWAIEVDKAVFAVDLWALLHGKLLVADIVLEKPRLWVEKNPAGVYNLAVLPPRAPPGIARVSLPWGLEVSSAEIIDGRISVATRNRHWDIRIDQARAESAGRGTPVVVDFQGAVEETPITASATLGSLETLFTYQPSALSIEGQVGAEGNRVRATGSARNLLKWRGIDLGLDFELARTAELSALARARLPDLGTVNGHARLLQPERFYTMALRDIELQSTKWGLTGTLRGEIARVPDRAGIDLDFSAAGILDQTVPAWLATVVGRGEVAAPLKADVTARLHGSVPAVRLHVEAAKIENAGLTIETGGEVDFLNGAWRGALPVSLTLTRSDASNELPGRALPPPGALTAEAELTRDQGAWRLNNVKLSLEREALKVKVAGVVNELTARPSGHLYVIAEAADGRYLAPLFDDPLPPLSALTLEAAIAFGHGDLRATVDTLNGRVYGADFSVRGAIAELHRLRGIDLAISGRADGLQHLPPLAGRALPRSGPVRVEARLGEDESGALHLTDITASVTGAPIELAARGELRNLRTSMDADLDVELTLADAGPAQFLFPDAPPAVFLQAVTPLTASGNLYSQGLAQWKIRDLKAASQADGVGAASLSGEVAAFAPLDTRLHLNLSDLAVSRLPSSWNIPRPQGGTLDVSMDLTARHGEVSVKNIAAALDSAASTMAVHGDIDRVNPIAINNMELKFEAHSVGALEWPAAARLIPDNPVSGNVTLMASGARSTRATVEVKIGENDLRGTVKWRWFEDKQVAPRIEGDLVSGRFNLAEIMRTEIMRTETMEPPAKQARFFTRAPLHTDWIRNLDGHVNLAATEAGNLQLSMRDVRARMVLNRGTLQQTVAGRMGQGDLTMSLAIDATARPFSAELKMHGKQLDTEGLVAFRKHNSIDNGTFDVDIELAASGASMAALAAGADGRVSLRLHQARMKNQTLDFIGGDIFTNVLTFINPFRSIGEYVQIECGVMDFDVKRGMASSKNGLAMKTDKVTLLGGGNIDLSDESLKILISSKARKGLGINPSSLAKIMRLGGTLAEPKIEADPSRLLETGAVVWAALYSGGLSVIAKGLFDRNQANADVCGLAGSTGVGPSEVSE